MVSFPVLPLPLINSTYKPLPSLILVPLPALPEREKHTPTSPLHPLPPPRLVIPLEILPVNHHDNPHPVLHLKTIRQDNQVDDLLLNPVDILPVNLLDNLRDILPCNLLPPLLPVSTHRSIRATNLPHSLHPNPVKTTRLIPPTSPAPLPPPPPHSPRTHYSLYENILAKEGWK